MFVERRAWTPVGKPLAAEPIHAKFTMEWRLGWAAVLWKVRAATPLRRRLLPSHADHGGALRELHRTPVYHRR